MFVDIMKEPFRALLILLKASSVLINSKIMNSKNGIYSETFKFRTKIGEILIL